MSQSILSRSRRLDISGHVRKVCSEHHDYVRKACMLRHDDGNLLTTRKVEDCELDTSRTLSDARFIQDCRHILHDLLNLDSKSRQPLQGTT